MKNAELANPVDYVPMSELANYHRQIEEKYKDPTPEETAVTTGSRALMAFNGYYTLNTAVGAFFAVDTNVYIQAGSPGPVYVLDLLISLDGKTSVRCPFTGTFDGAHLVQQSAALEGADINLTFTRTDGSDGTTAACSGTISLPGQSEVTVSGSTYNNPIPVSLFIGDYYDTSTGTPVKVMSIGDNYQVSYDNGRNNGVLAPVSAYVYNMNMYFFSFSQGANNVSLIMGTAAANGFACNNMIADTSTTPNTITTRSLLTIPAASATMAPFELYDIGSTQLAGFSGYYQVPSIAPRAFVSVQAQYITVSKSIDLDLYMIVISVSLDGITSHGYYFDPLTMSFENNTLTMPGQSITLTFNREYNAAQGSLVTITGSVMGHNGITGYTLLNPVPLSVFGGVPMTNANGDKLTVTNDNEVTYNGIVMNSILYVPLMYILAYPITNSTTVMSFGTDGLKGNTCIVTSGLPSSPATSVVYAIPDAQ